MAKKLKGGVRFRGSSWYVSFRLRSGRSWERPVPRPKDGGDYDRDYARITLGQLIRAYEAGTWDPEDQSSGEMRPPKIRYDLPTIIPLKVPEFPKHEGSVVYAIQAANGLIKIGTTKNLAQRFSDLQSSSPIQLDLIAVFPGGHQEESAQHRRFRAYRAHGEWFHPGKELLEWAAEAECQKPLSCTG